MKKKKPKNVVLTDDERSAYEKFKVLAYYDPVTEKNTYGNTMHV